MVNKPNGIAYILIFFNFLNLFVTIYCFIYTLCQGQDSQNGDIEDEDFSLQELYNFVQTMLNASEETKRTLQMECEEARFALKPWPIETTVVKEVDPNTCTCEDNLTSSARVEEIAAEIGQTLLHSQQLREKLAANLHKERQSARKPDVREIYASSNKPPAKEQNPRARRSASQQRQPEPRKNAGSAQRFRSVSTVRSRDGDERPAGRRPSITAKILQEPSKDNVMYRKPGQKARGTNFVLANKLSVRSAKQPAEVAVTPRESRRTLFSPRPTVSDKSTSTRSDEVETLSELDRLIKKFVTPMNSSRSDCPVHSENASGTVEQKVVTLVDAVEGLDRFGVPSSLIKILKTYHTYIKTEVFKETAAITKKQEEAASNFLNNFNKLAKKKRAPDINRYQDLLCDFSSLCKDSFQPHLSDRQYKLSKSKFVSLESLYNECNIRSIATELTLARSYSDESYNELPFDMKNWISNGIWNYCCISDLKDWFGTHCTRYSDRSQLVNFYDLIQKIQRKSYETELIELIMLTVIPKLKELFEPDSKEFIDTYKMIIAITKVINPRVPVLAKAENENDISATRESVPY